jgi:carbonic anhydrase
MNFLTVLEFSMARLKVPHIIVCGHYDCGAVRGSAKSEDHGVIENWLRNIRDVQRIHHKELSAIKDDEQRHRRLVELNVIEQCINVLKTGCVQRRRAESLRGDDASPYALPRVHALVFDPAVGLLKKLPVDWNEATQPFSDVYDLYPQDTPKTWSDRSDV